MARFRRQISGVSPGFSNFDNFPLRIFLGFSSGFSKGFFLGFSIGFSVFFSNFFLFVAIKKLSSFLSNLFLSSMVTSRERSTIQLFWRRGSGIQLRAIACVVCQQTTKTAALSINFANCVLSIYAFRSENAKTITTSNRLLTLS